MNHNHTRLLALQSSNRTAPREYRIDAAADEATIYLYDVIGYDWWTGGGITASQFAADISAIKAPVIHLRFNSPGGDVFDGRAICAAIDSHPARKIGHVDGLAASAASFILMHCDEVEMTEGAMLMIHNGWTMAAGDNRVMSDTASLLLKIDESIQTDYLARTNLDRETLTAMMDAVTWLTASEALEHGFSDRTAKGGTAKARASAWNLSAYENAPATVPEPIPEPIPEHDFAADHAHRLRVLRTVEPEPEPAPKPDLAADHAHRLRVLRATKPA